MRRFAQSPLSIWRFLIPIASRAGPPPRPLSRVPAEATQERHIPFCCAGGHSSGRQQSFENASRSAEVKTGASGCRMSAETRVALLAFAA